MGQQGILSIEKIEHDAVMFIQEDQNIPGCSISHLKPCEFLAKQWKLQKKNVLSMQRLRQREVYSGVMKHDL